MKKVKVSTGAPCILVVGTTDSYIEWLRGSSGHRFVFLTLPGVRFNSRFASPSPTEEALCRLDSPAKTLESVIRHCKQNKLAPAGICCFDCEQLYLSAQIARILELPYVSPESVAICRNKHLTAEVLGNSCIKTPIRREISSLEDLELFVGEMPGPSVIKPHSGTGSELVFKCGKNDNIPEIFQTMYTGLMARINLPIYSGIQKEKSTFLAEEMIEGREFSCDFIASEEGVEILRLSEKHLLPFGPLGTAQAYELITSEHFPIPIDELASTLERISSAIGLGQVICMVDFIIRNDNIVVIEVAPRPGGDCLPWLLRRASGLDILKLTADLSAGDTRGVRAAVAASRSGKGDGLPSGYVGLRLFARRQGVIKRIHSERLETDLRIVDMQWEARPGQVVKLPPNDYESWLLGHAIYRPEPGIPTPAQNAELESLLDIEWLDDSPAALSPGYPLGQHSGPGEASPESNLAVTASPGFQPATGMNRDHHLIQVRKLLEKRQDYLDTWQAAGCGPVYVLEEQQLRQKAKLFREAFRSRFPDPRFYYAMKSNNHPDISRILAEEGFGIDASSGVELASALESGAADIIFSGPGKTDSELAAAVNTNGRATILLDSFGELERLNNLLSAAGHSAVKPTRIGVRVSPAGASGWGKFGIPLDRLQEFCMAAEKIKALKLRGIQFHVSWNMNVSAQAEMIGLLGRELSSWPKVMLETIEFIDVGGGFWPEEGEWTQAVAGNLEGILDLYTRSKPEPVPKLHNPSSPITDFASGLAVAFARSIPTQAEIRICLEPGRWLSNSSMSLLVSVVDKKKGDLVITDAGTNCIGWERFEYDYAPLINLTRPAAVENPCLVFGSLCTPHDIWGFSYWGESIEVGDILLIPDQGAYTWSLRQNFIKPLPGVVPFITR